MTFLDKCNSVMCQGDMQCVVNSSNEAVCKCVSCDGIDVEPVCASNGKTFTSECSMKEFSCERQLGLKVSSEGPCGMLSCVCFLL